MKKTSNKIVFFGSGPVAAKSLELLLDNFECEAIITKPSTKDEMLAIAPKVPVFTVSNKSELDEVIRAEHFASKLGILIDFGILVSQEVIDSFDFGIVNSHFSLLPQWRGADPITFSILSGQQKTGVSLMLLVEPMDEGPLLAYAEHEIAAKTTTPELTKQLIELSDRLLKEYLPLYLASKITPHPQTVTEATLSYSRKLTKQDGLLDFHKPAAVLEREIRAFIEWPKSRTTIAGKDVVILQARVEPAGKNKVGMISKTTNKEIAIATKDGTLIIEALKPAGKQAMPVSAFLAGYGSKL